MSETHGRRMALSKRMRVTLVLVGLGVESMSETLLVVANQVNIRWPKNGHGNTESQLSDLFNTESPSRSLGGSTESQW